METAGIFLNEMIMPGDVDLEDPIIWTRQFSSIFLTTTVDRQQYIVDRMSGRSCCVIIA